MSRVIGGEAYLEILEPRRLYGEYSWITRKWEIPPYRYSLNRTPAQIKESTYNKLKIHQVIKDLEAANPDKDIDQEIKKILFEMCHNFHMTSVRFTGYILAKIMKRIYTSIYVNIQSIEKLRQVSTAYPILYIPTHRSYTDFLLVSIILFHFNLPLPAIAAGLDFLGLKFVRSLLRNCGAFFIRRQFADDKLYWTVFSTYVQSLLEGGEHPLEFFLEGTRSRSAKPFNPKLGLLKVALELFFTARVPDLTIVPISISYERTLEEDLFAYEMLGIPKPKETTTGLIKARKILDNNYGSIYVKYGDPISVRDFCGPTLDRSHHNLESKYEVRLSPLEQVICSDLGSYIVRRQQSNMAATALSAACLLVSVQPEGVAVEQLAAQMGWLHSLLSHLRILLPWTPPQSTQQLLQELVPHSHILRPGGHGTISLAAMLDEEPALKRVPDPRVALSALPYLICQHYANQSLQLIVRSCMTAVCLLQVLPASTKDSLLDPFLTLRRLLAREFVYERTKEEEDLEEGLEPLYATGMISIMETGHLEIHSHEELATLAAMLSPFLLCYQNICLYLASRGPDAPLLSSKEMAQKCQAAQDGPRDWRTLSLDTIANCISMLVQERALRREKSATGHFLLHLVPSEISRIAMELAPFIQKDDRTPIPPMVLPMAKL